MVKLLKEYIALCLERDTNAYPFADDKESRWHNDREQLGMQRMSDIVGADEMAPHLQAADSVSDDVDDFGPVPPDAEKPSAVTDPFNTDWSILPTRPMKGIRR